MKRNPYARLLATAILVLATLALALIEARTPPERRLAHPQLLTHVFEQVVFFAEHGSQRKLLYVNKWTAQQPILVFLQGDARPNYRNFVIYYTETLSRLTGLRFELTDTLKHSSRVALTRIHFGPRRQLHEVMRKHDPFSKSLDVFLAHNPICMATSGANTEGVIRRGFIYVSTDRPLNRLRACLLEEFTQNLGLPNDVDLILPTVFSDRSAPVDLTLNDQVLVRTLYDDRITPGMIKSEAMARARTIISELTAAVRRDGAGALIHPRHEARARIRGGAAN